MRSKILILALLALVFQGCIIHVTQPTRIARSYSNIPPHLTGLPFRLLKIKNPGQVTCRVYTGTYGFTEEDLILPPGSHQTYVSLSRQVGNDFTPYTTRYWDQRVPTDCWREEIGESFLGRKEILLDLPGTYLIEDGGYQYGNVSTIYAGGLRRGMHSEPTDFGILGPLPSSLCLVPIEEVDLTKKLPPCPRRPFRGWPEKLPDR